MNKKIILILMVLCLTTVAFAYPLSYERTLKCNVDDAHQSSVDETGGTINVVQNSVVDLQTKIYNKDNLSMRVKITLNVYSIKHNGDDINQVQDYYNIDPSLSISKIISFDVPDDAIKDTYDMTLRYDYLLTNGTTWYETTSYSVKVKSLTSTTNTISDLENLSNLCSNLVRNMSTCWSYVDGFKNKSDDLLNCLNSKQTNVADLNTCSANLNNAQTSLTTCNNEKANSQNDLKNCQVVMSNKIDSAMCNVSINQARQEEDSKYTGWIFFIIIIGIAAVIFIQFRKKKGAVTTNYNLGAAPSQSQYR